MSGPDGRTFLPDVGADLPEGRRPVIAVLHAVSGHEQQLQAAIGVLTAAVREEPGCREFRSFRDVADPGTFHLYEIHDDTAAFEQHLRLPHVGHFFDELAQHCDADAHALTQLVEIG